MDDVEVVVLSGPCEFDELADAGVGDMDVDASVDVTLDCEAVADDDTVVLATDVGASVELGDASLPFWASETAKIKTSAIKTQEAFISNVT